MPTYEYRRADGAQVFDRIESLSEQRAESAQVPKVQQQERGASTDLILRQDFA